MPVRTNRARLLGTGLLVVVAATALTAVLGRPTHPPHPAPNTHSAPSTQPVQSRAFPPLTPAAQWTQAAPALEQAVAAYRVR